MLSIDGLPYQGMDPFRNEVLLTEQAVGGESYFVEVESYVNWHSDEAINKRLHIAEIVTLDEEIHEAYWDFWCAYKLLWIEDLPPALRGYLENNIWDALKQVPPKAEPGSNFKSKLLSAQAQLRQTIYDNDFSACQDSYPWSAILILIWFSCGLTASSSAKWGAPMPPCCD